MMNLSRNSRIILIVNIYIFQGKAYIPSQVRWHSGPFMDTEPVQVVDISSETLKSVILDHLNRGCPTIPQPSGEELKARKDPIISATGARSWRQLAQEGASYTIEFGEGGIQLDISRLDPQGRWEYDPEKTNHFPSETPLDKILTLILNDIESRRL